MYNDHKSIDPNDCFRTNPCREIAESLVPPQNEPKSYAIRYLVEEWDQPPSAKSTLIADGVRVSEDNYGYTDDILILSCVKQPDGAESLLLVGANGFDIPRELLEKAKTHIEHHLKHHCK